MQDDDSEKSFDPTPKKLLDERRKGNVPQSRDMHGTAAYLGLLVAITVFGFSFLQGFHFSFIKFFSFTSSGTTDEQMVIALRMAIIDAISPIALLLGLPALGVVLSIVAQQSFTFTTSKIHLKLDRLSPLKTAKQKYGLTGIVDWAKNTTKVFLFLTVSWILLSHGSEEILTIPKTNHQNVLTFVFGKISELTFIFFAISLVISLLDLTFQRIDHTRKLRMSRKELIDEAKESEGDPMLKQERRQRGRERAMDQSIQNVETADVVIVNPTHYAVALHWSRKPNSAPVCVCKGVDEFAAQIRSRAVQHGVPIHEDPPTARSVYATTEVGHEISEDMYQAVAAAISFAEAISTKAKAQRRD